MEDVKSWSWKNNWRRDSFKILFLIWIMLNMIHDFYMKDVFIGFFNCDTQIEWLLMSSELYCFDEFLSTFVMKLSNYEICASFKLKYDRLLDYIVELMYMSNWLKFLHCWAYFHQIEETYKIVFLHCWAYSSLFLDCLVYVYIKLMSIIWYIVLGLFNICTSKWSILIL